MNTYRRFFFYSMLFMASNFLFGGYEVLKEDTSTTLIFSDVKEKKFSPSKNNFMSPSELIKSTLSFIDSADPSELINSKPSFIASVDAIVVGSTPNGTLKPLLKSGLISTIALAYSEYTPLELDPNDIWLTIAAVVATYLDRDDESTEKRKIIVDTYSPYLSFTKEEHWDQFLTTMAEEIDKNKENKVLYEFFMPNFSTTTTAHRVVGALQLSASKSHYVVPIIYANSGLPTVTLRGTREDWVTLRKKAALIKDFKGEMATWHEVLDPVLARFIDSYDGKVPEEFWQTPCSAKPLSNANEKYFSGWLLVFNPFNNSGTYLLNSPKKIENTGAYGQVSSDHFVTNMGEIDIVINDQSKKNGPAYHAVFHGGVSMPKYHEESNTLSPSVDWGIVTQTDLSLNDIEDIFLKNHYIKKGHELYEDKLILSLIKFSFHLVNQLDIPNRRLLELQELASTYYWKILEKEKEKEKISLDKSLLERFYTYLSKATKEEHKLEYSPHAYKDIEPKVTIDRMDEMISSFLIKIKGS